jgi:hypothetical protein
MRSADWKKLPKDEQLRFYRCPACGEMVDNKSVEEITEHHSHVLHPERYPGLFSPTLASVGQEVQERAIGRLSPDRRSDYGSSRCDESLSGEETMSAPNGD